MQLVHNGITLIVPDHEVVRLALDRLNGSATKEHVASVLSPPRIGEHWHGQGGVYAGLMRGRDGGLDYHLVAGPEHEADINFEDSKVWAPTVEVDGHRDFALPFRREQALLFANVPELFKPRYYWSCEQHAGYGDYAWGQDFDDGYQDGWGKDFKYRARLVRRLTI